MEVFGFKNLLDSFYQSNWTTMDTRWRNNKLGQQKVVGEQISPIQIEHFLNLMEDKIIKEFLKFDRCYKLADKYLLAMVFEYFVRAKLPLNDYKRANFFAALYLAHDIEEDDEDLKFGFVNWALGASRRKDFDYFISLRDNLWKSMDYRAIVCIQTCHEIMEHIPSTSLWERNRDPAHGGAMRDYEAQVRQEKCKNCRLLVGSKRFYWSDCELSSTDSDYEVETDSFYPPAKMIRSNEE